MKHKIIMWNVAEGGEVDATSNLKMKNNAYKEKCYVVEVTRTGYEQLWDCRNIYLDTPENKERMRQYYEERNSLESRIRELKKDVIAQNMANIKDVLPVEPTYFDSNAVIEAYRKGQET